METHELLHAASEVTGVPVPAITGRRRCSAAVTDARSIVIALSEQFQPHLTRREVAAMVGRKDKNAPLYHLRRIESQPHLPPLITQALALLK